MKTKMRNSINLVFIFLTISKVSTQVCSPPGQLCTATTDCCRGCCEQHTCVERGFACSADLQAVSGHSSCLNHYCPENHFCYLREVCPSPCPRMPFCRPFPVNATSHYIRPDHNGGEKSFYWTKFNLIISTIILIIGVSLK